MTTGLRAFPSTQTLEWVGREVGGRVVGGRRLTGGITSSVHRLAVAGSDGWRRQVVLRRWTDIGTDTTPLADRVRREAATLTGLAGTSIPAPELLAADPTGSDAGVPALLMTRVPGRVDLTPSDPDRWLGDMATTLAHVHDATIDAPRDPVSPDRLRARDVRVPGWTSERAAWEMALRVFAEPPPASPETLTHNDYQHFNLLWRRGRLTGVVDWASACTAPPERDLGHCRLNLAVLYSAEWAERFRAMYIALTGRALDPYWDLYEIASAAAEDWAEFIPRQVMGRAPFDRAGMHARIDELLLTAVNRL